MNFVSLRAADTAQREIRRYADACETFLAEKMPVTHAGVCRRRAGRAVAGVALRRRYTVGAERSQGARSLSRPGTQAVMTHSS